MSLYTSPRPRVANDKTFGALCYMAIVQYAAQKAGVTDARVTYETLRAFVARYGTASPLIERAVNGMAFFPALEVRPLAGRKLPYARSTLTRATSLVVGRDDDVRARQATSALVMLYTQLHVVPVDTQYNAHVAASLVPLAMETIRQPATALARMTPGIALCGKVKSLVSAAVAKRTRTDEEPPAPRPRRRIDEEPEGISLNSDDDWDNERSSDDEDYRAEAAVSSSSSDDDDDAEASESSSSEDFTHPILPADPDASTGQ